MRLPGTLNVPTAKKRAAGRDVELAFVVSELTDWSRRYSLNDFTLPPPSAPSAGALAVPASVVSPTTILPVRVEDIGPALDEYTRRTIELGDDPERPRTGEAPRHPSRSETVFSVSCVLARAECSLETIAGILINPSYGISESILEKRNPKKYALKQAVAAKAAAANGWPDVTSTGRPRPTMRNAAVALSRLGLDFGYDLFRNQKTMGGRALQEHAGEISDDGVLYARGLVLEQFGFDPATEHVRDAITLLCLDNAYHPLREYLGSLKWDGVPRIDRFLPTYLSAEATPFNIAVSRIMLIAAVRRVRQPGVKFDQIIVWEGEQGSGKSTALAILAGPGNHSDQEILTLDAKAQIELLDGVWIYELGEIEGFNRAEVNKIKAFASRTVDRARLAYGRFAVARPRQAIFVGTTNEDKYLRDVTGNRRFWPVLTGTIDLVGLQHDRDQLWAEAAKREADGESIQLPEELWEAAGVEQAARLEEDPWYDKLANERGQAFEDVVRVSTADLLTKLQLSTDRLSQGHTKRLSALMKKLGWTPTKFRVGENVVRGYERPKPEGHRNPPLF